MLLEKLFIIMIIELLNKSMIIKSLLRRFSNKKFYEIIQQSERELLPQIPQNLILSKYLQQPSQVSASPKWAQQKGSLSYSQLLSTSPHGSLITFTHRHHTLSLLSTNYSYVDQKHFHRALYKAQPQAIVLQARPQCYLPDFEIIKKGNDGIFSDKSYLEGLQYRQKTNNAGFRPVLQAMQKSQQEHSMQPYPQLQLLPQKALQLCLSYSRSYKTPIYLAEMPIRTYRQYLANTHTLMQLQQMFKIACSRLPRYKHLSLTPYQLACYIWPDTFLKPNDRYMSTVIQMIISNAKAARGKDSAQGKKGFGNIFGVFGVMQNQAVKFMLQNNQALQPIIEQLYPPTPKGNIVRDIQPLQLIQKHILLDVLFYSKNVLDMKPSRFLTTSSIIQKYTAQAHPQKPALVDRQVIPQFRFDKINYYIKMLQQKYQEGEQQIKKQFVRETLRQESKDGRTLGEILSQQELKNHNPKLRRRRRANKDKQQN